MLIILQIPNYCNFVFNYNFCDMGGFKYFLLCIMLPVLIALFVWWVPDVVRALCPHKCEIKPEPDITVKNIINEIISKQDIEKFITAAIIMGIQKFATNHPKTTEVFDNILDVLKNTNAEKSKNK